jgi:hypothetical protein
MCFWVTQLDTTDRLLRRSDGGGDGTRTHDPLLAKQVLYQLSYAPFDDRRSDLGVSQIRPLRGIKTPRASNLLGSSERRPAMLVGLSGIEPLTSRLSGGRSNP